MAILKKGQTVEFRNAGVPQYVRDMREIANTLALEIGASEIACSSEKRRSSPQKSIVSKLLNRG